MGDIHDRYDTYIRSELTESAVKLPTIYFTTYDGEERLTENDFDGFGNLISYEHLDNGEFKVMFDIVVDVITGGCFCEGSSVVYLSSIRFENFDNVYEIGEKFLYYCPYLKSVKFNFPNLQYIGDCCMSHCEELVNVDLSSLTNVSNICTSFMSNCNELEYIDLSPLVNLVCVEESFLSSCEKLIEVKLPDLYRFSEMCSNSGLNMFGNSGYNYGSEGITFYYPEVNEYGDIDIVYQLFRDASIKSVVPY